MSQKAEFDYGLAYGNTYLVTPAYADDIVLMSNTNNGLQIMLDNAYRYSRIHTRHI